MLLFLVSTVACTKAGELRKVITAHFGSGPAARYPPATSNVTSTLLRVACE